MQTFEGQTSIAGDGLEGAKFHCISWHFSGNHTPCMKSLWWPQKRCRTPYQGLAVLTLPSALTWLSWGFPTSLRSSILQQQLWLLLCDHLIVWEILHLCRIKMGVHFIKAATTFFKNVYLHVAEYVQMIVGWWFAF